MSEVEFGATVAAEQEYRERIAAKYPAIAATWPGREVMSDEQEAVPTNMDLWNKVCVTNPQAVKPITGKQYKGNSPKPYWLIQRATEVFGPVGIGWGVIVKNERFERLGEHDVLHVAVVSVWFVKDGQRSESFDQMGGTKASYMTASGKLMVDEDAGKKSVTDGMVKCLSMIGFAGDIFSGMWDDSKYVEWAAEQYKDIDVEAQRTMQIQTAAMTAIAKFNSGDHLGAYDEISGLTDNEEKLILWNLLGKENSKFRSFIKSHAQELREKAAAQ